MEDYIENDEEANIFELINEECYYDKYDGMKSGIVVLSETGEVIERKGTFKLDNEQLVGGWAEVFRKDWNNSIYCSVSLAEVIQKKGNGEPNSNWSKQPATMIEKVAKVRALREAFVEDLGGMYEAEEMNVELPEKEIQITKEVEISGNKQNDPFDVLDANGGESLPDAFK